jgi:hypothetical protein
MTHLRKMMLEELERRNYAQTTIDCYIQTIEDFTRYFRCPPDQLTPEHIREYQEYLTIIGWHVSTAPRRITDYSRTGCVVTQLGLGCEPNWVRGIANASGLHIGKYRAEPA